MMRQRFLAITAMALALSASAAAQSSVDATTEAMRDATEPVSVATTASTSVATATVAAPSAATSAGPRIDRTRAGFTVAHAVANDGLDPVPQPEIARRRGVPQMIVGGAAILGGAIVGGDAGAIVSLAGLGYGLYGLYLYLQ